MTKLDRIGFFVDKKSNDKFLFDSFGMRPPVEIIKYLKSSEQYKNNEPVIKCNALTVQKSFSKEFGALCLYVLHSLVVKNMPFEQIIHISSHKI